MIYSEVKFGKDAQQSMMKGVAIMSQAVGSTLGPQGRNVAIGYATQYGEIYNRIVVHDGVTVAKAIALKNEFEDMGAQLLKQAAQKQVQDVGDGTTVSIILADAILSEVQALIAAGVNPMMLRRSLEQQVMFLTKEIERLAIPLNTTEQVKQIAIVSAEDKELGELVAQVINDMGKDGLVMVEESPKSETTVEKQDGMQLEKGYAHPMFMTNPTKLEATLENPLIFVTDKEINSLEGLRPILESCAKRNDKIVLFTPQIGQDALHAMLQNKLSGVISSLIIPAPSFGQNQKNTLQDIAIFTGAKFITQDAGHKFEDVTTEDLGKADYVTATKTESIIVGGRGTKEQIQIRIDEIKTAIELEDVEFDREKMKERLAKLTTGVSVIKVGGHTEVEMKERLERVKDAVAATKAALKHGIVPGGETIYLRIRELLTRSLLATNEGMATEVLYKALYKPFARLLQNAGMDEGEWYAKLSSDQTSNKGVDVVDLQIKDMVAEGIVDPALVPINALKNASSVAIQIATTGTEIIQIYEKKDPMERK